MSLMSSGLEVRRSKVGISLTKLCLKQGFPTSPNSTPSRLFTGQQSLVMGKRNSAEFNPFAREEVEARALSQRPSMSSISRPSRCPQSRSHRQRAFEDVATRDEAKDMVSQPGDVDTGHIPEQSSAFLFNKNPFNPFHI